MDLNALRIFAEVARLGSFTAASKALQLPSTNVSSKVKQLEEELSTRLLNRTTRSVTLTEAGKQIYAKSQELISSATEIEALAASQAVEPQGLLRITAPASVVTWMLGDWCIEFCKRHPKVRVEMISTNRSLDFISNQLDFAFRIEPLLDTNLIATKVIDVECGLFASPALIKSQPVLSHPNQLVSWPCITISIEGRTLPWRFQEGDETFAMEPAGIMSFEELELGQRAAIEGLGAIHCPNLQVEQAVRDGELVPLLSEWWPAPYSSYLLFASREHMTAKNRCFLEFVTEKVKEIEPFLKRPSDG